MGRDVQIARRTRPTLVVTCRREIAHGWTDFTVTNRSI